MAKWICRWCEGGFPKPILKSTVPVCPWCAKAIGKPLAVETSEPQRERLKRHYRISASDTNSEDV